MNTTVFLVLAALTANAEEPAPQAPPEPKPVEQELIKLPDIESEAKRGFCAVPQLSKKRVKGATPGADQYYGGSFEIADDKTVTGGEVRLLFANDSWKAAEQPHKGYDCEVRWTVTGKKTPPSLCTDCDYGIHFEANVDHTGSTCPERISTDGGHFRGAYDIKLNDDGTLDIFFSNSGNKLGRGYHRGNKLNWLSEHKCAWF